MALYGQPGGPANDEDWAALLGRRWSETPVGADDNGAEFLATLTCVLKGGATAATIDDVYDGGPANVDQLVGTIVERVVLAGFVAKRKDRA